MPFIDEDEMLEAIRNWKGGTVDRYLVECVIDLNILVEPDPSLPNADELFAKAYQKYTSELIRGQVIIRRFAEQIQPNDIETMRDVYYSFTNSTKYRLNPVTLSVCANTLSINWDGVGEWRD